MAGEEMVKRLYETSAVNNNDSETCSTNATIATISFRGVIPSLVLEWAPESKFGSKPQYHCE